MTNIQFSLVEIHQMLDLIRNDTVRNWRTYDKTKADIIRNLRTKLYVSLEVNE